MPGLTRIPLVMLSLATPLTAQAKQRWTAWRADLDYLYEQIEKPATLKKIFEVKGIRWPRVRKSVDKCFRDAKKAAKKNRGARADEVAFYGVLRELIGQLRDSHAQVRVADEIHEQWRTSQPTELQAGIEFLPGTHGTILVANTYAARGANSPLRAKGIMHDATLLVSVDGVAAADYFERKAKAIWEQHGWQSSHHRAHNEALNQLTLAPKQSLKLVFKTIKSPEKSRRVYMELSPNKRTKAFSKLDWKTQKVTLRANECSRAQNARNFRFLAIERPELTTKSDLGFGRLESGTGYVLWWKVSDKSRGDLEAACDALSESDGLIIDMRTNGGGFQSGVGALDNKDGSWNKPVAFLIGPRAMSQAETELWNVLAMRKQKGIDARLFGRTTAGSSGDKIRFELPSGFATGQFVYKHWHNGTSTIEGRGIEPDTVVDQDLVELSLGIDSCVRAAEEWLADG